MLNTKLNQCLKNVVLSSSWLYISQIKTQSKKRSQFNKIYLSYIRLFCLVCMLPNVLWSYAKLFTAYKKLASSQFSSSAYPQHCHVNPTNKVYLCPLLVFPEEAFLNFLKHYPLFALSWGVILPNPDQISLYFNDSEWILYLYAVM